jgi:type I restriction enzyme, S subunit
VIPGQIPLGRLIRPAHLRRAEEDSYPILSMTMHDGLVDQGDKFKKRVASSDTSEYKVVKRNQLVVGFPIDEGVLSFQNLYDEAIVSPAYDIWELDGERQVDNRYLERFLRSRTALAFYAAKLRGTTARRRSLPDDIFLSLAIPLPDLLDQRRISEILDRAEALRTKRGWALARLDALARSIFLDLFGDPSSSAKGWNVIRFEDALSMPLRNGLSPSHSGKIVAKVLTLSAITGGSFDASAWKVSTFQSTPPSDQTVNENDFLICRGSGSVQLVGRGCFPSKRLEDVAFPDTMIAARVNPERINRTFLQSIWNSTAVRRQIDSLARTTNGTLKVNQTMLENITLLSPPLRLQQEFERRATSVERLRTAQLASLAELDALFGGLQHRAFRGEL